MPDYIYIDPGGNMVGNDYQPHQQAAIEHARDLAADHQLSRICVAEVIEYRVTAPQCHICHNYFAAPVYDRLRPTCPACDKEPTCPFCGSQEILNHLPQFICSNCGKDYSQCLTKIK